MFYPAGSDENPPVPTPPRGFIVLVIELTGPRTSRSLDRATIPDSHQSETPVGIGFSVSPTSAISGPERERPRRVRAGGRGAFPCAAGEAFSPSGPPNGYESGHLVGRVTSLLLCPQARGPANVVRDMEVWTPTSPINTVGVCGGDGNVLGSKRKQVGKDCHCAPFLFPPSPGSTETPRYRAGRFPIGSREPMAAFRSWPVSTDVDES